MSHVTAVALEVKDLDCLKAAAKAIGMELVEKKTFKWYGTHVGDYPLPAGFTKEDMGKCEFALSIPGKPYAYEVGVCKSRDGRPGYTLLWDFWAGGQGLRDQIGAQGEKLKQSYAVQVAKKQMQKFQRDGYRLQTFQKPDGTQVVKAVRG